MESMDNPHQVFKTIDNDIMTEPFYDIIAVFPEPNTL